MSDECEVVALIEPQAVPLTVVPDAKMGDLKRYNI